MFRVEEAIEAGKRHSAQPEDVYGCLYFFLSDKLRLFSQRIRQLSMSFRVFTLDARELPQLIQSGTFAPTGLESTARFDRIEVSNILDPNYVGLKATLRAWAPLLSRQRYATVVGYFMNWFVLQKDGRIAGASQQMLREAVKQMAGRLKVSVSSWSITLDLPSEKRLSENT